MSKVQDSASLRATTGLTAKNTGRMSMSASVRATANVDALSKVSAQFSSSLSAIASVGGPLSMEQQSSANLSAEAALSLDGIYFNHQFSSSAQVSSTLNAYLDKFNKIFDKSGYDCLFPTEDISAVNTVGFNGVDDVNSDLYQLIDENTYSGKYGVGGQASDPQFFDDNYIYSSGDATYTCRVSNPCVSFRDSKMIFRAGSNFAQSKIYDIEFKDPSGQLICRYEDIEFTGDNEFATFVVDPVVNNGARYTWEDEYPLIDNTGCEIPIEDRADSNILDRDGRNIYLRGFNDQQFTLTFKTSGDCPEGYDSFSDGFDEGFEFCPDDYTPVIKIATVEICNSGDQGFRNENLLNFYVDVQTRGDRLEKCLTPKRVLHPNFNTNVWPDVGTVWLNDSLDNTTEAGQEDLAFDLGRRCDDSNINLGISTIPDSGKLHLQFETTDKDYGFALNGNSFSLDFNPKEFDTRDNVPADRGDGWFTVDEIYLKVRAKKASGSRDYTLDVVGWSDDGLLGVTSDVGGFLQNTSGTGEIPASGHQENNEEAISAEALSDKDEYYEFSNSGDHYSLYQNVVTSTEYQDYIVPLKIVREEVELGVPTEYNQASYFEKLFLDIYPIPDGASISYLELCFTYKPSNALSVITLGGDLAYGDQKLVASRRQINDSAINVGGADYSLIEGIPHGYTTPETIKSNYSRRWVGSKGIATSSFALNEFDLGFEQRFLPAPFLLGYYDFNDVGGGQLNSRTGGLVGTYNSGELVKNIGLRFVEDVAAPNGYKSLYPSNVDNYSDSFDNAFAPDNSGLTFADVDFSQGMGIYCRFSPKNALPTSGTHTVFTKGSELDCKYNADAQKFTLRMAGETVTTPLTSSVWPVSVLATYTGKVGLYVKPDDGLVSKSHSIEATFTDDDSDLVLLPSGGFEAYLHTLGLSDLPNLLDGEDNVPVLADYEQTAQSLLYSNSVHWWSDNTKLEECLVTDASGEVITVDGKEVTLDCLEDTYTLPDYIDEDTEQWQMGDFKFAQFQGNEFSTLTNRVGRDAINFRLVCDGAPYSSKTDLNFPTSIDDTVSYHTQIENDFLRFNLSDTEDSFYSTPPRIVKQLPRGYKFNTRAIAVDTILDYAQSGDLTWANGESGTKLIVSLYTPKKVPTDRPTENYGLVNRQVHYLPSYTGMEKIRTVFDHNSLLDDSEAWAKFPEKTRLTEFDHKYYSDDIDEMFLQYDLVTPSGGPFDIELNLHSVNIRLENAILDPSKNNVIDTLNLITGGEFISPGSVNLVTDGVLFSQENVNLETLGEMPTGSGDSFNIVTDAVAAESANLNLVAISAQETAPTHLTIYSFAERRIEADLNLMAFNDQSGLPSNLFLPLYTHGGQGGMDSLSLTAYSSVEDLGGLTGSAANLFTISRAALDSNFAENFFNLHTTGPTEFGQSLNLYVDGAEFGQVGVDQELGLFTYAYPPPCYSTLGKEVFDWTSQNLGVDIDESDESVLEVASIEPIRDAQTMCADCSELDLVTHEIDWLPEQDLSDGILRSIRPYYNSDSAFGDTFAGPYAGHVHGVRKYTGLYPSAPYNVTVQLNPGENTTIQPPKVFTDWEYGRLGDINYSGIKLAAENRAVDDKFGKSVKVKGDLMAIGAPGTDLGALEDAGTIYLYERDQPTSSGDKPGWSLSTQINLPSGLQGDYFEDVGGDISFPGLGTIPEKQWYIGQEGRELGHSIDLGVSEDRQVLVAGGPGAKWTTRSFDEISTSGVNVAIMVFNNEFEYNTTSIQSILSNLKQSNLLYKYFAQPAVNINLKIISYVPSGILDQEIKVNSYVEDYLTVKKIPRQILNQPVDSGVNAEILQGIKDGFFEAFPYDNSQVNNNIPPIVGFYVDSSRSLGRTAIEPAIDEFVSFYQDYSLASGVTNFYGQPSAGHIYEYVPQSIDEGEEWFNISNNLVNELLDTGRMVETNTFELITSGVGIEFSNLNANEFNNVPDSGGRAYVFEKEGADWNLIQQFESPLELDNELPSRFGHSVSISDDLSTIAVGSPFVRESCQIYNFDPSERNRLYDNIGGWLSLRNNSVVTGGEYGEEIQLYQQALVASGVREAGRIVYNSLSATDKYKSRSDFDYWKDDKLGPIQEYKLSYKYGLDDLQSDITGTFKEVVNSGAPNPRLGYSSAVSEDGALVAFGAPTDSIGANDSADIYFLQSQGVYNGDDPLFSGGLPAGSWASNLNAGAVRLFEKGGQVVPIIDDSVYEYNRYGNLSRTLNGSGLIENHPRYVRSSFVESAIPSGLGTALIITPEIDANNDEVVEEIKNWLALGDRKLVLVGDDPVWEADGKYRASNQIINTLLEKLGSRMRLRSARSPEEALFGQGCTESGLAPTNITASYVPRGSNPTSIESTFDLYGMGVADIRLHVPELDFIEDQDRDWGEGHTVVDNQLYGKYSEFNSTCRPPIKHEGDLRARWTEREKSFPLDPDKPYVYWERNVPFEFGSVGLDGIRPSDIVDIQRDVALDLPGLAPRPVMVAAQFTENIVNLPAQTELTESRPIIEYVTKETNTTDISYLFADEPTGDLAFDWGSGELNYNIGNAQDPNLLFNPEGESVLQANGTFNLDFDQAYDDKLVANTAPLVAKQAIFGSEVYLIASVDAEGAESLSFGNDENISFYDNLVRKSGGDTASIVQLGGWTGRNSFAQAYDDSRLADIFKFTGHRIQENGSITNTKDVVWIANPAGLPNEQELASLTQWLSLSGKKLVITYDTDSANIGRVQNLCESLGLGIKPRYLESALIYPIVNVDFYRFEWARRGDDFEDLTLSTTDRAITGYGSNDNVSVFKFDNKFCPIEITEGEQVIWHDIQVFDAIPRYVDESFWSFRTGVTRLDLDVSPGSGYRLYYSWKSEDATETVPLRLYAGNVVLRNSFPEVRELANNPEDFEFNARGSVFDYDQDGDSLYVGQGVQIGNLVPVTTDGQIHTDFIDIQVPSNVNTLPIYIEGNTRSVTVQHNQTPKTVQLVSVSGSPLEITKNVEVITKTRQVPVVTGYEDVVVREFEPAKTVTLPSTVNPISTDNTKYCVDELGGGRKVADGPVVVAEEPESFSAFSSGLERSKIILIADSSILNGCFTSGNVLASGTPTLTQDELQTRINNFVDSFALDNSANDSGYRLTNKIVSPEKGSAGIYAKDPVDNFTNDSLLNPDSFDGSIYSESQFSEAQKRVFQEFGNNQGDYGYSSRVSVTVSGQSYSDSRLNEQPYSEVYKATGQDLIDHLVEQELYPGDLFGRDIAFDKGRLVVGCPFNAWASESIVNHKSLNAIRFSSQGGAGCTYVFEKDTVDGWSPTKKLKPETLSLGDKFGWSVDVDADFAAVGAPGHDYSNQIDEVDGGFVRKEFDNSFNIGSRTVIDLGPAGTKRNDRGAVFTFEDHLYDFINREKQWEFREKILPQGYQDVYPSSSFGDIVSIDRESSSYADYLLAVGSPTHPYALASGDGQVDNAGTAYQYDATLKNQVPVAPSAESWLEADVFGQFRENSEVSARIDQSGDQLVVGSGVVYSNSDGEILVEVSGQDPREIGFISQRPYLASIYGVLARGEPDEGIMNLTTEGAPPIEFDSANLFTLGPDQADVYNSMNISSFAANLADSSYNSQLVTRDGDNLVTRDGYPLYNRVTAFGMNIYVSGNTPISNENMNIMTSGDNPQASLNLRVRGK